MTIRGAAALAAARAAVTPHRNYLFVSNLVIVRGHLQHDSKSVGLGPSIFIHALDMCGNEVYTRINIGGGYSATHASASNVGFVWFGRGYIDPQEPLKFTHEKGDRGIFRW